MGLYSLVGIVFMMLATIVVTREPNGTDLIEPARKKRSAAQAPRRPGGSLSLVGGPPRK
jgi:hypothetical protein